MTLQGLYDTVIVKNGGVPTKVLILMKPLKIREKKNVKKSIAVYLQNHSISTAINHILFILVQKSLANAVLYDTKFATQKQLEAKI